MNIFAEGELDRNMVCANFAHTTQHGAIEGKTQTRELTYYNLDVIISVGYCVKSYNANRLRLCRKKKTASRRKRTALCDELIATLIVFDRFLIEMNIV